MPQNFTKIRVSGAGIPKQSVNNWVAHIIFTRGKHELSQSIEVDSTDFSSEITIPVGTWDISMYLMDDNDVVVFQDKLKNVTIFPDKPSEINFELSPASGLVQVVIDLDAFPQGEKVLRARVHFNDEVKEITISSGQDPLEAIYEIPPGSYDFKVELFTESFRAGDKIDPGIWETIHVQPLSEQTITWSPYMQDLYITVDIFLVPAAPTDLAAIYKENQVLLTWKQDFSQSLAGYNIYWQISPFEPFQLIGQVDEGVMEFVHDLKGLEDIPTTIYYTIAGFSPKIVGYRALPVSVVRD